VKHLKNTIWLFVIAVVCLPVGVFSVVNWYEGNFRDLPVYGEERHTIGDFQMTDQHGNTISENSWKNKIVVADFFFTHCPTVCPKMTKNLKTVQASFLNDPGILIQSFTVDPERDNVDRLANYASQFSIGGDQWSLLTGDKKEIYRLARKSFLVTATDGDGGPEDFIHSDKLVLIDAQKRIRGFYDGTSVSETRQLIKDINKLKNQTRN
jgi:protein SCO1